MIKEYKAEIKFKTFPDHPNYEYIKDMDKELTFSDIYHIDTDYFDNNEHIINYIKNDLLLVAGGGYSTEHIHGEKFEIK